jgi:hypothetical protein
MQSLNQYKKRAGSPITVSKVKISKNSSSSTVDTDQVSSRSYKNGVNIETPNSKVNNPKRASSAIVKTQSSSQFKPI